LGAWEASSANNTEINVLNEDFLLLSLGFIVQPVTSEKEKGK
jgi:hypothetical protein